MSDLSRKTLDKYALIGPIPVSSRRGSNFPIDAYKSLLAFSYVLGAGLLYCLAIAVLSGTSMAFDSAVLRYLHRYQGLHLQHFASLICMLVTIASVSVLAYLCFYRRWRHAWFWLCSTAGASILCGIAKKVVERHRPDLWPLTSSHASFSFPSGHATQSMAFVIALFLLMPPHLRRAIFLAGALWISLVGICRMYLGLHYPTDIFAGWALALAWCSLLGLLFHLPHGEARRFS